MKQFLLPLFVSLVMSLQASAVEPYDLIVLNGRVVDGTGNPWFHGDVAVRGDRIVAVGKLDRVEAKRTLNAKGLVVSPGFIDMHSHSDFLLLEDGDAQSKIRQGVTTEILGEGDSAAPAVGKLPPKTATSAGQTIKFQRLDDYFQAVEKSGIAPNVASYVGLNNVWRSVMGNSFDRPSPEQLGEMPLL